MTETRRKLETMFEADMARAKPPETAKADEIDEFDVRLAYLAGIARAFEKNLPPATSGEAA
jgi:hypothetical protein